MTTSKQREELARLCEKLKQKERLYSNPLSAWYTWDFIEPAREAVPALLAENAEKDKQIKQMFEILDNLRAKAKALTITNVNRATERAKEVDDACAAYDDLAEAYYMIGGGDE